MLRVGRWIIDRFQLTELDKNLIGLLILSVVVAGFAMSHYSFGEHSRLLQRKQLFFVSEKQIIKSADNYSKLVSG